MTSADQLLDIARQAATHVIGPLQAARADTELAVETKSSGSDLVTAMDRWVEQTLVEFLTAQRPDDGIIGEEGSTRVSRSGVEWVLDPIDGTTNFVRDLPGFSVSIAARQDGHEVAGLVVDPIRNEWFEASADGGARVNGSPLSVSEPKDLSHSLIATGFSYDANQRQAQGELLTHLLPHVADIRRFGGAAIDCCGVAAGRFDAYFETGLQDWDIAAGSLIVRQAGGLTFDFRRSGGPFVAVAPNIADPLLAVLGLSR